MIELRDVSLSAEGRNLIDGLCLVIESGEIVAITGKSGAGKTLLCGLITGTLKPRQGDIFIDNMPLFSYTAADISRKISFPPKNSALNPDETVYNYLLQARSAYKKPFSPFSDEDYQTVEKYVSQFKLGGYTRRKIGSLSGGEMQTAENAFSFIRECDVMVLDCPAVNLDLASEELLAASIIKYTVKGERSVIMALNDINFAARTADRIFIMNNGKIAFEGTAENIDADLIRKYFDQDVLISKSIYTGKPRIMLNS